MAINLYDQANELERALRQSDEFLELKKMYDEVNNDESANKMFENFRNIQMTLQQKQMNGQEITQEEVEQAQKTAQLVQQHEKIGKLMEAEQRMSMVINDLNKVIMKPLEELYGSMQK
ncbi:YlbF family regulator [Rossellomorea aquimaris]|uniref:YlbF family regulator n=1 Tax=Rossellomorea aquimaris TaxID=189382 RepID=UPI001CD2769B|nr:YlbF family regulator [Rossellomorea aquimaris]MCA1056492.1 YlbF family regulator [Rossellomorea aquimaris]